MFFISLFVFAVFGWTHIFWLKTLELQLIGIVVMILANLVLWKFFMNKKYIIVLILCALIGAGTGYLQSKYGKI